MVKKKTTKKKPQKDEIVEAFEGLRDILDKAHSSDLSSRQISLLVGATTISAIELLTREIRRNK